MATTLVELHSYEQPFVTAVSARPVASLQVQLQAADEASVTNLRHKETTLESSGRQLLPALDGSRDRATLLAVATDLAVSQEFTVREGGKPVRNPKRPGQLADPLLDTYLVRAPTALSQSAEAITVPTLSRSRRSPRDRLSPLIVADELALKGVLR